MEHNANQLHLKWVLTTEISEDKTVIPKRLNAQEFYLMPKLLITVQLIEKIDYSLGVFYHWNAQIETCAVIGSNELQSNVLNRAIMDNISKTNIFYNWAT